MLTFDGCTHDQQQQNQQQAGLTMGPLDVLQSTDTSSVFLLWFGALCVYQHVVGKLLGGKFDLWKSTCRLYEVKKRHGLCAGRMARFLKCAKRCNAKRNPCLSTTTSSSDSCVVGECLAKLAKMHLPPPLPWRKKKSRKHNKDVLQDQATFKEDQVSSEGLEAETVAVTNVSSFVDVPKPSLTPLIDLARMQSWELVLKQASRRGAKYRDMDGLYPLHWAVSGSPPQSVVETLLKVYPSASHKRDKEGSTPLHFATHYAASSGVVELLLKSFPKAVRMQDLYGRSPLYHAVDKCLAMESLKLLVQADPSMVTVPCVPAEHRDLPITRTTATMTPLYIAWARVVRERRIGKGGKKQCKPLEKAHFLLEASFFHLKNVTPSVPRDYYFVSGAIAMDVYLPDEVVPLAVEQFPKELSHADEDGRVALAQAAATRQYSRERSDTVIGLLLDSYKEAAYARDRQGRSPLQLALFSGKTWSAGVSRLFAAYPDAIRYTDHGSGLPPFAAAASLEAQEAEDLADQLVGEAPLMSAVARNDPYNILSAKQKQLLEKARKRLMGDKSTSPSNEGADESTAGTERLTTILHLLQSEPSVLSVS